MLADLAISEREIEAVKPNFYIKGKITQMEADKGERAHPRPISAEIDSERAPPLPNFEFSVEVTRPISGRFCHSSEPPRDRVAPVDALGRLPCLENEEFESVVGTAPCVPPSLTGSHPLGEVVQVAPPEGTCRKRAGAVWPWRAATERWGAMERLDRKLGVPCQICGGGGGGGHHTTTTQDSRKAKQG